VRKLRWGRRLIWNVRGSAWEDILVEFFKGFLLHLLGFTNFFAASCFAFLSLGKLVESPSTSLESEIEHADCFCQVKGTRNTDELNIGRQFVDSNEWDNFSSTTDEEIAWPWLAFCVNLDRDWRHSEGFRQRNL
jgi:hypothetical protein